MNAEKGDKIFRRMKLLIVTQTLDRDDPILGFFHRWVEEFAKQFERVTVIALSVGAHKLPDNVTIHTLGKEYEIERFSRTLRYIALLVRLRDEYTHVFAHMNPEYVIGGGLIWRLLGKKIGFWYVHGTVSVRLRIAAFLAHRVFTASRESCRIQDANVIIVGHGIDTDLFSPQNVPHSPTVVSIGRVSPSKRLEKILDAYARIRKAIPDAGLIITGVSGTPEEKEYAQSIEKQARTAGASVLPPVPNREIPALLHRSDIFLSASETGSLDKAVLEAMSAGVVPIASNRAYESMLAPLGLSMNAEAFAEKCIELLRDRNKLQKLARSVREEIVMNHSLSKLMPALASRYGKM